ncbi:pyridoxamine 5'-phosphate oxidase family protein [Streptomyces sp. SCSIO ZS0520]|uniref:pyridoxamine 5'-phosphate oxidase family protein n=1 Tax=Streptomyces sp. SCSIO ZS0520 TaxID=2892996 RepID=UPI0021DA037F|nr:pyridoxamine 5'-phosphate oxidase family protein [Streptomyces sp. SCSIO ZS0520]
MATDPRDPDESYLAFWREPLQCTLTTLRPDGTPHSVPVNVTYDPAAGLARVLAGRTSTKVRNILAGQRAAGVPDGTPAGAPVSVSQHAEGGRWATLEGRAVIRTDPQAVADGERRSTERYGRTPRENPERVVIEIHLTRAMGRA